MNKNLNYVMLKGTNNKNAGLADLVITGVRRLKNYGFDQVDEENILSDEVYVFFFIRFLSSQKGKSDKLDKQIEMLLCLIREEV